MKVFFFFFVGNLFTELGSQVSVPSHQITNAGLQKPFIAYELCSIKDRLDFAPSPRPWNSFFYDAYLSELGF